MTLQAFFSNGARDVEDIGSPSNSIFFLLPFWEHSGSFEQLEPLPYLQIVENPLLHFHHNQALDPRRIVRLLLLVTAFQANLQTFHAPSTCAQSHHSYSITE